MSTSLAPTSAENRDTTSPIDTRDLRNLDVLRSVAVLLVFFGHTANAIPKLQIPREIGRLGVLLFFVHTSLVLLMSLERSGKRVEPVRFYIRRFFRIYPLSILCIAVVLILRIPPLPPDYFVAPSVASILRNVTLTQNLFVPERWSNPSVIMPLWSLPFEVQMYLFLPFIYAAIRKYGQKSVWLLIEAAIVIAAAEIVAFPHRMWVAEFLPCFMGGVLAYSLIRRAPSLPPLLWPLSLLTLVPLTITLGLSPPVEWTICLAAGAAIPLFHELGKGLAAKACFTVARYSYGIYLCHVPLLWLCFHHLQSTPARWASYLTLVIIVPFGLYHLVESPLIKIGRRITARR